MWSGVDPDVELFASGKVLDDDGEWSGGHAVGSDGDAAGGAFAYARRCHYVSLNFSVADLLIQRACRVQASLPAASLLPACAEGTLINIGSVMAQVVAARPAALVLLRRRTRAACGCS